jgi:putative ABC transport system permease protein
MLAALYRDARFGARLFARHRGLTVIASICLALGIGVTTTLFTAVNHLLLEPLGYGAVDRLVVVHADFPGADLTDNPLSEPELSDLLQLDRQLDALAAFASIDANVALHPGQSTERIVTAVVSPSLLTTLGVTPHLGRDFRLAESEPGHEYSVMLSYELWRDRFAADRTVIGRTVVIDTEPHTIIGVVPASFRFPLEPGAQLIAPMAFYPEMRRPRGHHYLRVIARLRSGQDVGALNRALAALSRQLEAAHPADYPPQTGLRLRAVALRDQVVGPVRAVLWMLAGAAVLVLLIACSNVSGLLLAQGLTRRRELALRAALGAGRGRLVGQLLAECSVLVGLGAVGGLLVALWGVDLVAALAPAEIAQLTAPRVDRRVVGFAVAVAVLSVAAFAALPAYQAAAAALPGALRDGGERVTASRRRLRNLLVAAEVALAVVLVTGAGLLTTSLTNRQSAPLGFERTDLTTMTVKLPYPKYPQPEQRAGFYQRLFARLRQSPDLAEAGGISQLPLAGPRVSHTCEIEGAPAMSRPDADVRVIAGDYFAAMNIPVLAGRGFAAAPQPARAVVVDELMAERFLGGVQAVGRRLRLSPDEPWLEVVGVVGHVVVDGFDSPERPQIYLPYRANAPLRMTLAVRSTSAPEKVAALVQTWVRELDPEVPVFDVKTMRQRIASALATRRFATLLLGLFAAVALVLAALGIYAVVAFHVACRTREIAIRVALGARPGQVVALIAGQGLRVCGVGVAVGTAVALGVSVRLTELLDGIGPGHVPAYLAAAAVVGAAALVASLLAARRATRVDPIAALRD